MTAKNRLKMYNFLRVVKIVCAFVLFACMAYVVSYKKIQANKRTNNGNGIKLFKGFKNPLSPIQGAKFISFRGVDANTWMLQQKEVLTQPFYLMQDPTNKRSFVLRGYFSQDVRVVVPMEVDIYRSDRTLDPVKVFLFIYRTIEKMIPTYIGE